MIGNLTHSIIKIEIAQGHLIPCNKAQIRSDQLYNQPLEFHKK